MAKTWTVIYRTGGTANFQWKRTVAFETKEAANVALLACHTAGIAALVHETSYLDTVGLPETFNPRSPVTAFEFADSAQD